MYRRDMFTDDPNRMLIAETARNIPVDRIDSPYTLSLEETRSTLAGRRRWKSRPPLHFVRIDGVVVRLCTQIPCQLRAFWFVNIPQFYAELDARDFRSALSDDRFLISHSIHRETFK